MRPLTNLRIPEATNADADADGISPLLSRAPPPPPPAQTSTTTTTTTTTDTTTAPTANTISQPQSTSSPTAAAATSPTDDDKIPAEHKRVPLPLPRSPLSPIRGLGVGLGLFMSRSVRRVGRKPVPPPIVVVHPPARGDDESDLDLERGIGAEKGKTGSGSSPKVVTVSSAKGELVSPALSTGGKKRRTVWGLVDGWWDLGLLERMGTVRRKR